MKAFFYIIKIRLLISLTYRFEVITSFLSNVVMLVASLFLWRAAYKGSNAIAEVSEGQMIIYVVIASILGILFSNSVYGNMRDRIERGEIGSYFIRPFNIAFSFLAEDLGEIFSRLLLRALPLLVISFIILRAIPLPANGITFIIFLLSCVFSYGILWLISFIFSCFLLWFINLSSLDFVKDVIVRILSGSIVPLWFFPPWFNKISNYLPFKYTYQTPIAIYIGKLNIAEAGFALLIQLIWLIILSLTGVLIWNFGKKKVLVQGG